MDEFYKRIIVEVAFKIVSDDRENLFNNVCDLGDREFWEKRNTWESVKQDLKRTIEELKESIKQENVDNKKITR